MNTLIVNETFSFVKWLYSRFLPGNYSDFQLEQSVAMKNTSILVGRRAHLEDKELEILALSSLLYNTGCIEGQYEKRAVSMTIAKSFLKEKNLPPTEISKVLSCIRATERGKKASNKLEELMKFVQDTSNSSVRVKAKSRFRSAELPDVFP